MSLDHLRTLVDLPTLVRLLEAEAASSRDGDADVRSDPGALLGWYGHADEVTGAEVAAGRATEADAHELQQQVFDLLATVPGLQFVTNGVFGLPHKG